jgi:hypothetical protein
MIEKRFIEQQPKVKETKAIIKVVSAWRTSSLVTLAALKGTFSETPASQTFRDASLAGESLRNVR